MAITHEKALEKIKEIVGRKGRLGAAKELDISVVYLGEILRGTRPISENVAQRLGYRRVVQFIPAETSNGTK